MENTEFTELSQLTEIANTRKENKSKLKEQIEYVNPDEIEFEKPDVAAQQQSLLSIFNAKPSFQVTCSQSGYMAKVSALIYKDIVAITNSNLSNYENKKEIYKIIFSKITGYSAENWKPSFDEWLKATSLGDVETLFYGMYCATFQDKSTIRYNCPYCDSSEVITINNKQLIRVDDRKEMLELTKQINSEAGTYEKIKEFSSVSDRKENKKSVKLPDTKIIFTIKMPNLFKTLDVLKTFSDEEISQKSTDALNIVLATEAVAIPNAATGKYSYIESKKDIFTLVDLLSINDFSVLKEIVNSMLESKHITYCVENQKCSSCGNKISKIPLDIESLLFFQISERQLL